MRYRNSIEAAHRTTPIGARPGRGTASAGTRSGDVERVLLALLVTLSLLLILAVPAAAQDDWDDDDWGDEESVLPVEIHGYAEAAGSSRITDDPAMADDFLLGEARFRLDLAHYGDRAEFSFKGDFVSDAVLGETVIDIRRTWLNLQAASWLDMRLGRQVLTWGTGDLVFLNDLFAKDFQSFFIGRNDEFLKAPSNTLKFSAYSKPVNVDFAWTPVFTPDNYITGERLSYYDPMRGGLVGTDTSGASAPVPDKTFENGEFATRLFRNAGSYELAAYGYWGFFKQPLAYDTAIMSPTFSKLAVGGASVRGATLGGLFNLEGSYYYSRDDSDGDDPFVPNSEIRGLVGYERELVAKVTLGLQYYLEWLQQYDALLENAPDPDSAPNETRQMATVRLTWRLMQDTLTLSLFGYVGLGDGDTHWRPSATRQLTDAVEITAGANIMTGPNDTFFGQLENNSNAYLRVRYSF